MFEKSKKSVSLIKRLFAVVTIPALFVLVLTLSTQSVDGIADAMYVVSEDAYIHVNELTPDVFVTNAAADLVSYANGKDILLSYGQNVTISYQGQELSTTSNSETVTSLLRRLDIKTSPLEMVAVAFEEDQVRICIDSEFIFYEHDTTITEHETVYQYSNQKPSWYEGVVQAGSDGVYSEIYEVIYQDGEEISRQLIDIIDTEPVQTIIEIGTLENFANNADPVAQILTNEDGTGTITLENGEVLTFGEVRTMTGTAYTAGEANVDSCTATGTLARVGVVAVDKRVLPLGSKVYVVSSDGRYTYGFAIAEDTGVRGNSIDLYYDTLDECIQFGRRDCTVYILD